MVANLINVKVEFVPWFKIWFVMLFGFAYGKMKVLKCHLSRKWDFSLYDYMFDNYDGWVCPSMSLEANHGIFTYLLLSSVNKRYWDDPCRENEILAYMVANLINEKIEFVPWFKTWFVILFGFLFGKWKYWNDPCRENEIFFYMVTSLINMKVEFVSRCPLQWSIIFAPIWF